MDWTSISLTPPLTRLRKARAAGRSGDADLPAVLAAFTAMNKRLADNDFLAGDRLSLADIAAGPSVHRWFLLPEAGFGLAGLSAYAERLADRPGYRRHVRQPLS